MGSLLEVLVLEMQLGGRAPRSSGITCIPQLGELVGLSGPDFYKEFYWEWSRFQIQLIFPQITLIAQCFKEC